MDKKEYMSEIRIFYNEDGKNGWVSINGKHDNEYYLNQGYGSKHWIGCHESISDKDCRYINFIDHNNILRSRNKFSEEALAHKRDYGRYCSGFQHGFDHTTQWRNKFEQFPLFILTEPYHLPSEDEKEQWDESCDKWNLKYKIYEPSQKSLWVPDSTYMIFWWCPKYYDFDDALMNHDDAKYIYDKCKRSKK